MSERRVWGIFRERAHSPGRESDDAEILRLTAKALEGRGFSVSLKDPEEIGEPGEPRPPAVFLMCERVGVLRRLGDWAAAGTRAVNAPRGVFNTYRARMLTLWTRAGIPAPASRIVPTDGPLPREAAEDRPIWVKRADVHNTQEGDVVFGDSPTRVGEALAGLARRGIPRAVLQEHLDGDLLKFYGVGITSRPGGAPAWFQQFYHRGQEIRGHSFDPETLASLARRAAGALGLEVFGGDAIVTIGGRLVLIDLNAWPSFALYRDEAATEIAAYLGPRFVERRASGGT